MFLLYHERRAVMMRHAVGESVGKNIVAELGIE